MELKCGKEKKSFTFTSDDTPESREATIRQAFGLPDGIPIVVIKKIPQEDGSVKHQVVGLMALSSTDGTYEVSLEQRASFITKPTHLVLRSKKKKKEPEKIEISTVFTEVDFVSKYDEVNGLQLLCHFAVSWGISNNQGFDTHGSPFYISSLDARCTLLASEGMTLLTRDHLPKDEWQSTSRTDTRGWNIGAELTIPNVAQSGAKLGFGYTSTKSHQSSATGMVATNHEFWPGKVDDVQAHIPDELFYVENRPEVFPPDLKDAGVPEIADGRQLITTTLCTDLRFIENFVLQHRWQVELRHLMTGELWSSVTWRDIAIEDIPLEAFGNKTKDFFISYRALKEDNVKAKAYFIISARVRGRKTKASLLGKKFDFRQIIECYVALDENNKMDCRYKVWEYTNPYKRGVLLTETNRGQEKRSPCWLI